MAANVPYRPSRGDKAIYRAGFGDKFDLLGITVDISGTSKTITRLAGDWLTDGVEPGDRIRILGTTQNNSVVTAELVSATVITLPPGETLNAEFGVSADFASVEEFEGTVENGPRGTLKATPTGNTDDLVIYGPPRPGQPTGNGGVPVQWDQDPPLTGPDSTNTARPGGASERARQSRQTEAPGSILPQGDYVWLTGPLTGTITSGVQGGAWEQVLPRIESATKIRIDVAHRSGSDVFVELFDVLDDGTFVRFHDQLVTTAPSTGPLLRIEVPIPGSDKDNPTATRRFGARLTNGAGGGPTPWLARNFDILGD